MKQLREIRLLIYPATVVSCILIKNYEIVLYYFSRCPSCINNQWVTNFRFKMLNSAATCSIKWCAGNLRCFDCNSYDDNCGNFDESTGSWRTCSESAFCITQSFRFSPYHLPFSIPYNTHECSETAGFLGLDTGG